MYIPNQYGHYGYSYHGAAAPTKKELSPIQKKLIERMQKDRSKVYQSYEEYAADTNHKQDNYFPSKSGWMVARTRVINGNTINFIGKAKECPVVEDVKENVTMEVENKIPGDLLREILANFNKVNADSGNECAAQIYRERDGERKYFIYYPEQKVSTARVTYADDPKLMDLAKEYDLIMELHSHDSMGAFWSGTDDANENTCGYYMVIGRFNSPTVEYKCRVKLGDTYANFECSMIFDFGDEEEQHVLTRENFIKPNDLLDAKITKESYTYSGYSWGDRYGYYGDVLGSGYSWNAADDKELKALAKDLKDAPDVIVATDKLYDRMWENCTFNKVTKRFECCGYYEDAMSTSSNWKRIKNRDAKREEVKNVAASDYVNRVARGYSAEGFQKKNIGSEVANGYDTAEYLKGTGEEAAARYGVLPGKIGQYTNFDLDIGTVDANDKEYNDKLNQTVSARTKAQSNIENFMKEGIAGVREETSNEFLANVMNAAFLNTPAVSINIGIFWELLTPVEKGRLAKAFHTSVVDLAELMRGANSIIASPLVSEFLYKCIVGDPKYVEAKLGLITTKVMAEKPTSAAQFIAAIQEMLNVGKEEDDNK